MKAIGAARFLPVEDPSFLVEFDAPMPEPGPLDLLVELRAVAVNPVDTKVRAMLGEGPHDPPRILGWDAAGVVVAAGKDVRDFKKGDEVWYAGDLTRAGCNAEYQCVDSRLVSRKPTGWSFEDAAAVPLVALTAWELMFERMGIDPGGANSGDALLVINGAGGVGSALIPLAKSAGLRVVATASRPETIDWCRSLGADEVINHRELLRPQAEALGISVFPWIANLYSTDQYWEQTGDLLAPLGALGLIVEPREKLHAGDPLKMKCARIAWEFMAAKAKFQTADMASQGAILAEIAGRCEDGRFPRLATRMFDGLTVENLRQCHRAMEHGEARGKWVLTVSP
ncbi:MAG: zinc-binding alcohol dehydrogenase family protein [Akkermansiaceae bacterium]|nr:zinc-binding alcohol dehydrogenase family protein [Akkermansiaceae bacterium]MCP5547866.1 zinc-binding alcohol dehydrogenase family protein [Akkermansiaceae bacterium]